MPQSKMSYFLTRKPYGVLIATTVNCPEINFQASNETMNIVIVPKFAAIILRHHPGEYQSTTGISGDDHRKHNQK